ncbi:MAG: hypothetical protein LBC11_03100 [Puniceicoccales bacterium]|jgi:hypothetical protein|nr:hypothetical protein [Puniceicoccales bacterium]
MDSIAHSTSLSAKLIVSLEETVEKLRNGTDAQSSNVVTVVVNGKTCTLAAVRTENNETEITAKYYFTSLGSRVRQQVAKFVYDKKDVGNHLREMVDRMDEIDQTSIQTKAEKITRFTTVLGEYVTKGIDIGDLLNLMPEFEKVLDDMQTFVLQNDLSSNEISTLRTTVVNLGGNNGVIRLYPGHSSSINESTQDLNCLRIATRLEAIKISLDAKEKGYVGLERNGPHRLLGKGRYNTVQFAYAQKGEKIPIALKPCDLYTEKEDKDTFALFAQSKGIFIGLPGGTYSRNEATSRLQDMLCGIGSGNGITVPHVIASAFAAEIGGIPCIGMEWLNGRLLGETLLSGDSSEGDSPERKFLCNNNFLRLETWIQLIDVLTGQIDRHANNLILTTPVAAVPTGHADDVILTKDIIPVAIDHDLSFPTSQARTFAGTIPKFIVRSDKTEDGHSVEVAADGLRTSSYCMPPVIDNDMLAVIRAINLDELRKMYQECGLTSLEIDPAMARTEALKAEAEELNRNGCVIDPDEWERSEQVKKLCNAGNFYAKWHIASCQNSKKFNKSRGDRVPNPKKFNKSRGDRVSPQLPQLKKRKRKQKLEKA